MVAHQGDQELVVILDRISPEGEFLQLAGALPVHQPHPLRELVELRMPLPGIVPEDVKHHPTELGAGHLEHVKRLVKGRVLQHVLVLDDGSEFFLPDGAGAEHHDVEGALPLHQVRIEISHLRLLDPAGVGQLPRKVGDDALVLCVCLSFIVAEQPLHDLVCGCCLLVDRNASPGPSGDLVPEGIILDVKAADLVRAASHLDDRDAVHDLRGLHKGVGMSADDQVHTPVRIQKSGQLPVLLDADVGEEDDHIRLSGAVVVADDPDFLRRLDGVDKGADDLLIFRGRYDLLRQDPDEHDLHAVHVQREVGFEKAGIVQCDEEVRVDDRETGALLQEQKVGDAVIHFMVSHRGDIRGKRVHEVDGGKAQILGVDDGAPEHISRVRVDDILLFRAGLSDIACQSGEASGLEPVLILRQEIPVQVVGVQDGKFFLCHDILLSDKYSIPFFSVPCIISSFASAGNAMDSAGKSPYSAPEYFGIFRLTSRDLSGRITQVSRRGSVW